MYHPNNPKVIEAANIARVLTDGAVRELPDGSQALSALLVIRPESGKHYAAGTFPLAMHLTDGVNYRTLSFEPVPAPEAVPESAPDITVTSVDNGDGTFTHRLRTRHQEYRLPRPSRQRQHS